MSRRIEGIRQGARRRRRTLLAGIVAIGALGIFALSAIAVHDLDFQLDGNVVTSPDEQRRRYYAGDRLGRTCSAPAGRSWRCPRTSTASGFDRDFVTNANGSFNTSDNTTFATGSKDTLNITPGWQCNVDNNVLSKNDVMNAYAASYEAPGSGDEILYFALERNANTGTANVAFWFLQDETVGCTRRAAARRSSAITSTATSWSSPSSPPAARSARSRPTAGTAARTAR